MKKVLSVFFKCILTLSISAFFSGCIKDTCKHIYSYTFFQPMYKTTAEVRANIKSNPAQPIVEPGKIVLLGKYIFLNEVDKGIHIIDNSNPSNPKNIAFIDIPGNEDLAVKGNTLYADLYTDLVCLDISNPLNIVVKNYNDGVFPSRSYANGFYGDTTKVIVNWIKSDTTVVDDCNLRMRLFTPGGVFLSGSMAQNNSNSPVTNIGQTGSMARFAIMEDRMYTVSYSDLNVFNISNPFSPSFTKKVAMNNWNIETIFPFKSKLFIGSQNGIFIYNTNDPDAPALDGQFGHFKSCDPVIADDSNAFVTLRSGNACQGFNNELDVLQLNSLSNPQLIKTYNFTNPHGLSKDGNILFVCDGADGLKIYDAGDVRNLKLLKQFEGIETYDVIATNNIALVVAKDGLYQYDYTNENDIKQISKIAVAQ
ncbi:MAG: hypothetical protein M3139_05760 [Bacteroidota bacterium]|nr:hypothetical protein [Bacteroidota bacterium]